MAGKVLNARFSPRSAHMEEANKLIGAGKKFLVMGKAVEAVSALQEACGMLWVQLVWTEYKCAWHLSSHWPWTHHIDQHVFPII